MTRPTKNDSSSRMTREQAKDLEAALAKLDLLQFQAQAAIQQARASAQPLIARRDALLKGAGIELEDLGKTVQIDFETGAITRKPVQAEPIPQ